MKKFKWFKRFKTHISWITAVIAAGAAIASVLLTLDTLEEMRIDRDNAYRPEIIALQETQVLETSFFMGIENGQLYAYSDYGENEKFNYLELYNIGVGAAKNVKVKFDTKDIDELADWIKNNLSSEFYILFDRGDPNGVYTLGCTEKELLNTFSKLQSNISVTYILPEGQQKINIGIPNALIGLMQWACCIEGQSPKVDIIIEWQDIKGKSYEKKYIVQTTTPFGDKVKVKDKNNTIKDMQNNFNEYAQGNGVIERKMYIELYEDK